MKQKALFYGILFSAAVSTQAADNSRLSSTLKAIERPINVATERAEDLYLYNGGSFLTNAARQPTHLNLLINPADAASSDEINDYLQELRICEKYWVKAKLYDADAFAGAGNLLTQHSVPVEFAGTNLYIVPVVYIGSLNNKPKRNYLITAWECLTDLKITDAEQTTQTADAAGSNDLTASSNRVSTTEEVAAEPKQFPFAGYTTHPILEKCSYVPRSANATEGDNNVWEQVTDNAATGVCQ